MLQQKLKLLNIILPNSVYLSYLSKKNLTGNINFYWTEMQEEIARAEEMEKELIRRDFEVCNLFWILTPTSTAMKMLWKAKKDNLENT